MTSVRNWAYNLLRRSERLFKTDMVYLTKSGFWLNLNSIFINLLSFLISIAFARLISKESFGTYQFLLSIGTIITAFTLTGMNNAVTQAVAQGFEGVYKHAVKLQLKLSVIPAAVGVLISAYYFYKGNTALSIGILFISFIIPIFSSFNLYQSITSGRKDFRGGFFFSLFFNGIQYGIMFASLFFIENPVVLVTINLSSSAILAAILYKKSLVKYKPNSKTDASFISYGKHLSLMSAFATASSRLDSILAFHYLGAAQLAVYFFATTIPSKLGGFFKAVPVMALPKFAEKNIDEVKESILEKTFMFTAIAALMSLVYILAAPSLYKIFFPQYMDAVIYSQAYALVVVISTLTSLPITALYATRSKKDLYIYNTLSPIFSIAAMFVLIVMYGIWGLIIARGASNLFNFLVIATLIKIENGTPDSVV